MNPSPCASTQSRHLLLCAPALEGSISTQTHSLPAPASTQPSPHLIPILRLSGMHLGVFLLPVLQSRFKGKSQIAQPKVQLRYPHFRTAQHPTLAQKKKKKSKGAVQRESWSEKVGVCVSKRNRPVNRKAKGPATLRNSMKFKFEILARLCLYTHPEWEFGRQLGLEGGQPSRVFSALSTGPQDFAWGWG